MKKYIASIYIISVMFTTGIVSASEPLKRTCSALSGVLKSKRYIVNLSVTGKSDLHSVKHGNIQVLYDNQWYLLSESAAYGMLSTVEISLMLHRPIGVCAVSYPGKNIISAMEFGSALN